MADQSRFIKAEIRSRILDLRSALDDRARSGLDRRIREHLFAFTKRHPGPDLAAYSAFRGEPDLMPALERLHREGRRVHLPVLEGRALKFRRWTPDAAMQKNQYGIDEPTDGAAVAPGLLVLVFLPLVAFAPDGARLGMGAGYYDRTFSFRRDCGAARPLLAGVAYAMQEVGDLPVQDWDVKLDAVITEEGVREFGNENRKSKIENGK